MGWFPSSRGWQRQGQLSLPEGVADVDFQKRGAILGLVAFWICKESSGDALVYAPWFEGISVALHKQPVRCANSTSNGRRMAIFVMWPPLRCRDLALSRRVHGPTKSLCESCSGSVILATRLCNFPALAPGDSGEPFPCNIPVANNNVSKTETESILGDDIGISPQIYLKLIPKKNCLKGSDR